jgi:putative NADPH-quinone reductase
MKVLTIEGSYRAGGTIETLVEQALQGMQAVGSCEVERIRLVDKHIEYCRNCMVCMNDDKSKERARCVIHDDMDALYSLVQEADGYIFGTPVNMGHVTAVMKTFLERLCWVFARPGRYPLRGCPEPRGTQSKFAAVILSSGVVPPILRWGCDDATSLIRSMCHCSLKARMVGSLYAGAVHRRGKEYYAKPAYKLGQKLARRIERELHC